MAEGKNLKNNLSVEQRPNTDGSKSSGKKSKLAGFRKTMASPAVTVAMFVIAAVMLLSSTIGGTRAALTYYSETYTSQVEMKNIGVSLMERNRADAEWDRVAWRDYASTSDGTWVEEGGVLLSHMLEEGMPFQLGRVYNEELAVLNSGTIDQYVRVTIYKYWLTAPDEKGERKKAPHLSPDLIDLNLVNLGEHWLVDEAASTEERTVLYYKDILKTGQITEPLCDTLSVDSGVAVKVTQDVKKEGKYTTITTIYDYDGVEFRIEAEVDAVQTHNAEDAIWSAWGRRVSVSGDGSLTLQ